MPLELEDFAHLLEGDDGENDFTEWEKEDSPDE